MKKFLLSLATVLCMGSFASADEVTVAIAASNFTEVTTNTVANYTSDGFTFTLNKADATTNNRLSDTNHLRIYKGATFTVASNNEQQITQIEIAGVAKNVSTMKVGDKDYTWTTNNTLTWTGDATSVVFSNPNGQTRITSVKITYTSAGGTVVDAPTFSPEGGKYTEAQTITLSSATAGTTIYYTLNGATPTDNTTDGSTKKYTAPFTVDKTTTVKAIAIDVDDNKSGVATATYEIVEEVAGAEGDGTEANPFNAIGAYNAALLGSTANVYVKGIVVSKSAINTTYSSINYYISADGTETDQFYIYSGLGLAGAKFTSEDELNVGDNVVVYGKLSTYKDVPQLDKNSKIISINGKEPDPIVLEGEGTEANPFTVADVIAINPSSKDSNEAYPDKYWVKGFIVGYSSSKSSSLSPVFNADNADSATNIILGPTADTDNINLCIPVQLPTSGTIRAALNLKDNPGNFGKEVYVYGNIYSYFGVPGMRNTSDYKIDPSGVAGIEFDENAPVEYFNLQGVRVENPANGLYIMRQGDKVVKVIK